VLLYGANGTGKTSVLSALELALTGEIRSMRRHDARYTAHLPFHGQEFATVTAQVSDAFSAATQPPIMTVGGSRIDGLPAFGPDARRFYSERCYLDQVSLGQLLELYQYREGKEESALARFVNELLGLEQLDALRSGLDDANNYARLRKLSEPLAEAEIQAKQAESDLSRANKLSESAKAELSGHLAQLLRAMAGLGFEPGRPGPEEFASDAAEFLRSIESREESAEAQRLSTTLVALGGKLEELLLRPSMTRLDEARSMAVEAAAAHKRWQADHGSEIARFRSELAELALPASGAISVALEDEIRAIDERYERNQRVAAEVVTLEAKLIDGRAILGTVEAQLGSALKQAGSLAAAFATLREFVSDNTCPVCDRDFTEVSTTHLGLHLDQKISELTDQGRRIQALTQQQASVRAHLQGDEQKLTELSGRLLDTSQLGTAASRRNLLNDLRVRHEQLQPLIVAGVDHLANAGRARADLAELEATADEENRVRMELDAAAQALRSSVLQTSEPLVEYWRRLASIAAAQVSQLSAREAGIAEARTFVELVLRSLKAVEGIGVTVGHAAQHMFLWNGRIEEAKRRQAVARQVHTAASSARAAIVQRVFTKSLNEVWRSVFSRLAPREIFVPAFGIPTSSKTALELKIETVHSSGETGGSPQMMLSAGNLNTAALSLFVALHLAVDPVVPCLVFDDPVQSMDEVHIAQFAGLIRVLSKFHRRQVVIAVHERALFDYLSFELSPAFEGDELITIELGELADAGDRGIRRLVWLPDQAIAS